MNEVVHRPGAVQSKDGAGQRCQPLFVSTKVSAREIWVVISSRPGQELLMGRLVDPAGPCPFEQPDFLPPRSLDMRGSGSSVRSTTASIFLVSSSPQPIMEPERTHALRGRKTSRIIAMRSAGARFSRYGGDVGCQK